MLTRRSNIVRKDQASVRVPLYPLCIELEEFYFLLILYLVEQRISFFEFLPSTNFFNGGC